MFKFLDDVYMVKLVPIDHFVDSSKNCLLSYRQKFGQLEGLQNNVLRKQTRWTKVGFAVEKTDGRRLFEPTTRYDCLLR